MKSLLLCLAIVPAAALAASEECNPSLARDQATADVTIRQRLDFKVAREIRGIWINHFEGSSFHADATTLQEARGRKPAMWLSIDDQSIQPEAFKPQYSHAYRVTMIAREACHVRRTPFEGYGHFGMWPNMILVDRFIAWEDLGPA